jgi:hypothetical protein
MVRKAKVSGGKIIEGELSKILNEAKVYLAASISGSGWGHLNGSPDSWKIEGDKSLLYTNIKGVSGSTEFLLKISCPKDFKSVAFDTNRPFWGFGFITKKRARINLKVSILFTKLGDLSKDHLRNVSLCYEYIESRGGFHFEHPLIATIKVTASEEEIVNKLSQEIPSVIQDILNEISRFFKQPEDLKELRNYLKK